MPEPLGSITVEAVAHNGRDQWLVRLSRPGRQSLERAFPDRAAATQAAYAMGALHDLPVLCPAAGEVADD